MGNRCGQCYVCLGSKEAVASGRAKARKEASTTDLRKYAKKFAEAKRAEYKSWHQHDVFDLVDTRTLSVKDYVTGRWALTAKHVKDGNFQKCKARWVLRGVQDKQKWDQQTDLPTTARLVSGSPDEKLQMNCGLYAIYT